MSKKLFYYGSTTSFQNLWSNNLGGTDERVIVPDNSIFSFTDGAGNDTAFSITTWVKFNGANAGDRAIMTKFNLGNANLREWVFYFTNRTLRFGLFTPTTFIIKTSTTTLSTGVWYFCRGIYNANETTAGLRMYVDEVQVDNGSAVSGVYAGMSNTTEPVGIGANADGSSAIDAKIYHAAIWNKELTNLEGAEIMAIKGGDLRNASCSANLVEAWKYNTGIGDYPTIFGYENGNNGTMTAQENTDINTDIP